MTRTSSGAVWGNAAPAQFSRKDETLNRTYQSNGKYRQAARYMAQAVAHQVKGSTGRRIDPAPVADALYPHVKAKRICQFSPEAAEIVTGVAEGLCRGGAGR